MAVSRNGHWDESILDGIELSERDAAIEQAVQHVRERYGDQPGPGGGVRELSGPWLVLRLRFIDGTAIQVVAQRLELEIQG